MPATAVLRKALRQLPCPLEGSPLASEQGSAAVHGLWLWKGPTVLEGAKGAESLRDFCRARGVTEVYVSVSERGEMMSENRMARVIAVLHTSNIHVEALLSSENADEGGKHLEKLLDRVRLIVESIKNIRRIEHQYAAL